MTVGEGRICRNGARPAGGDVCVDLGEQRPDGVRESLDVAARVPNRAGCNLQVEAGVAAQNLVGSAPVADKEVVWVSGEPSQG